MRIVVLKQCQREIQEFPISVREQLSDYLELLTIGEVLLPPASKSLSSIAKGLHELRMKDASGQYRVIYLMRSRDAIYLLHGFKKKTQHIELRVRKTIDERLKQI
jgi:phage-related protein